MEATRDGYAQEIAPSFLDAGSEHNRRGQVGTMRGNVQGDLPHRCVLLPMIWLAIAAGGALGAAARHALNAAVQLRWGASGFPLGILVVNVVGCLAIGVVAGLGASARVQVGRAAIGSLPGG